VRPQLEATSPELCRSDGSPMTEPHAAERYTTTCILDAEIDLLDAAREHTGQAVPTELVRIAVAELEHGAGARLDDGQRRLAQAFCADDRRIVAAVGPAGSREDHRPARRLRGLGCRRPPGHPVGDLGRRRRGAGP